MGGDTAEEVFEKGDKIIQILLGASFTIKKSKVKGPAREIQFLGVKWQDGYHQIPTEVIDKITAMAPPTSKKEMQAFLGAIGFWRMHIPEYSQIISPLYLPYYPDCMAGEGLCLLVAWPSCTSHEVGRYPSFLVAWPICNTPLADADSDDTEYSDTMGDPGGGPCGLPIYYINIITTTCKKNDLQQQAFEQIKQENAHTVALGPVRTGPDVKNVLYSAARDNGPSWSLWQKMPGEIQGHPLGFWNQSYRGSEANFTQTKKEILAAYEGVQATSEVTGTEE
ncbi:hypothetical protein BTVI_47496 [Pitangus sulphuratus]|nr:hypothetical protein BTVI_47496 [Pitangus sulphuratus]